MKILWLFACIVAAFVIQSRLSVFGLAPNLTALLAYYFGIKGGAVKGMALGSMIGVIEDSVGGSILGPNLLGKGMVGFLASFSSGSLLRWTPLLGAVALFALTVMDGAVVFLARSIFGAPPGSVSAAIPALLAQGFINLVPGIFIRPQNGD
jgi:rod shape-determining protein MreD